MSIYARVSEAFAKECEKHNDDLSLEPILDGLSPDELDVWRAEVELSEELRPEYGAQDDFGEILEREICARGIEAA